MFEVEEFTGCSLTFLRFVMLKHGAAAWRTAFQYGPSAGSSKQQQQTCSAAGAHVMQQDPGPQPRCHMVHLKAKQCRMRQGVPYEPPVRLRLRFTLLVE
jgi:hypothetical protein